MNLGRLNYLLKFTQNGSLLVFDMRQSARPLESLNGLKSNPVLIVHSLCNSTTPSGVLRNPQLACHWSVGGSEERSFLVSETGNQGVRISLAYCPSSDDIIASYRSGIDFPDEMASSQLLLTPVIGQMVQGSHDHLKRARSNYYQKLAVTCANVNDVRSLRSIIMNIENHGCLFASRDEHTGELNFQELPTFIVQHLRLPKHPIHDVKYAPLQWRFARGCLSEDILQLFSNHAQK